MLMHDFAGFSWNDLDLDLCSAGTISAGEPMRLHGIVRSGNVKSARARMPTLTHECVPARTACPVWSYMQPTDPPHPSIGGVRAKRDITDNKTVASIPKNKCITWRSSAFAAALEHARDTEAAAAESQGEFRVRAATHGSEREI